MAAVATLVRAGGERLHPKAARRDLPARCRPALRRDRSATVWLRLRRVRLLQLLPTWNSQKERSPEVRTKRPQSPYVTLHREYRTRRSAGASRRRQTWRLGLP